MPLPTGARDTVTIAGCTKVRDGIKEAMVVPDAP